MPDRILLIDKLDATRELIPAWVAERWPDLALDIRDPARGCPGADFPWGRYRLLLLGYKLGLPAEDGLDWMRRLRGRPELPPIIMLTGFGDEATAVQALKLGASDYLSKRGLTRERLLEAVGDALAAAGATAADPATETTVPLSTEDLAPSVRAASSPGGSPGAGSSPRLLHGRRTGVSVPGYEVIRELGSGGMATVHLARRAEDGELVALKILPLTEQWDTGLLRRFVREYNLLGQLSHPNVVRTYERAFARDFAYIAMEFFERGDLADRIAAGMHSETAVAYLRQIASGLAAAHEVGILHRDIKPSNVLFRGDGVPAIVDFGISKLRDHMSTLSMAPGLMGTPSYLSPEQILEQAADERSDFYSLGVMFYEMLTGDRPFHARNLPELLEQHVSAPVPQLPPHLARLQPVVDGLLAKDPDERFQTTEELLLGIDWD